MRILRPAACLFLLALTLGAPAAFASPAPTAGSVDLLLQLRVFLVSLWSAEGCEIDPLGSCVTGPKTIAKEGCELDPLGRCLTGTKATTLHILTAKAGCEIDPLGRCLTGPKATVQHNIPAREGCRIDPWGKCIPSH